MSILEMTPLDIEYGGATSSVYYEKDEVESACFSDEGGSCYSQFYSTADGYDDYGGSECEIVEEVVMVARRLSLVSQPDVALQVDKVHLEGRDCRICHLGLDNKGGEGGGAIQLGCSCKDDLAAAHKKCAETWFRIKGNKTCEICNSIASNVTLPSLIESVQQINEMHATAGNSFRGPVTSNIESPQSCFNGNRFMNFLLACMVFAFIISWLFHFNIPT